MYVFVLSCHNRTGTESRPLYNLGVFSSREKACAAILYWATESKERFEGYSDNDWGMEEYITDKSIYSIEKVEVDFVV